MLLKNIRKILEQLVFVNLGHVFHTGLTELHMFFMTKRAAFFSSTILVISRLVFFLIRSQSSEGIL